MAVTCLRDILEAGVQAGASDWHIREGSTIVLRVSGSLTEIEGFVPDRAYLEQAPREMVGEREIGLYSHTLARSPRKACSANSAASA